MTLEEKLSEERLQKIERRQRRREELGLEEGEVTREDYLTFAIPSILYLGRIGAKEQRDIANRLELPENFFTDINTTLGTLSGITECSVYAMAGHAIPWFAPSGLTRGFAETNQEFWMGYAGLIVGANALRFGYSRLTGKSSPGLTPVSLMLNGGTKVLRLGGRKVYNRLSEDQQEKVLETRENILDIIYGWEKALKEKEKAMSKAKKKVHLTGLLMREGVKEGIISSYERAGSYIEERCDEFFNMLWDYNTSRMYSEINAPERTG